MFELMKKAETVTLFEKGERQFWQESYISDQLLKTHLSQDEELASRKGSFIERSINFIKENLISPGNRIIDFGCGPGLYCQAFGDEYYVTGIDFSKTSIAYAEKIAKQMNIPISYHCQDYLEWQGDASNDLALLIYCDYGALGQVERQQLLMSIYSSLKVGGKLFLDVFSLKKFTQTKEARDWYHVPGPGFWRQEAHGIVSQVRKYPGCVTLEQTIVLTAETSVIYNIWYQYFERKSLMTELKAAGFKVVEWFSDVAGSPYRSVSQTIAVIAEKR